VSAKFAFIDTAAELVERRYRAVADELAKAILLGVAPSRMCSSAGALRGSPPERIDRFLV
jgi:hypothetical protein